jgi:hypothetical protein
VPTAALQPGGNLERFILDVLTRSPLAKRVAQLLGVRREPLSLGSGWVNFGSGFAPASYTKFGPFVIVEGLIKNPGGAGSGSVPATLPVSPANGHCLFAVVTNSVLGRVDVNTGGAIVVQQATPAGAWVSLWLVFTV